MTEDVTAIRALEVCADLLSEAVGPWWVIGGAALWLLDKETGPVHDIDILLGREDAKRLADRYGWLNVAGDGDATFRSSILLRPIIETVQVEFMAGLEICTRGEWREWVPSSCRSFSIGHITVRIPDHIALFEFYSLCNRPKDKKRLIALSGNA